MPEITRPDGAVIHYEVFGRGHPFLLLAPGGVNSQIDFWRRSAINPIAEFADEFMVIGMDQRHSGQSPAPMLPFSYAQVAGDQIAVLDAVGVRRAHVMGGCIGCAYAMRLIHDAPDRISAGVLQDPVGLDATNNMQTFYAMFDPTVRLARTDGLDAVVASALANPIFVMNNSAGPFAQRLHDDGAFREQFRALGRDRYLELVQGFRGGMWPAHPPYFSVDENWVPSCPAPLLVLPGSDAFHPTSIAHRVCAEAPRASCLDIDARSPARLRATIHRVRAFLREHAG